MTEPFDAMAAISALPKHGRGLCFERLERCFPDLWAKLRGGRARVIHIVGSNGKGSTALFLDALLRRSGLRTGLYVSPHYFDFSERIALDGVPASPEALERGWRYFVAGAGDCADFGSFEAITVMACHAFAEADLDVLVVEAGIGGRYDPTRLLQGAVGILTSLDLEHTRLLGETLEEIAADKMDVVAPGGTIVTGWLGDTADFCQLYARLAGIRCLDVTEALAIDHAGYAETGLVQLERGGTRIAYRIPAEYFVRNTLLAYRGAQELLADRPDALAALARSFAGLCADFTLVGRFERLSDRPLLLCDMAHTPDAIRQVVATCTRLFGEAKPAFLTGMSIDKHWPEMAAALGRYGDEFLIFAASHKGEPPESLAAAIHAVNPDARIRLFGSATAAAAWWTDEFRATGRPAVMTGGIFSSIEFRTALSGGDISALDFY
ncbi:MAG: cyanophycin synthetase [Pseudomonadota bacterium]